MAKCKNQWWISFFKILVWRTSKLVFGQSYIRVIIIIINVFLFFWFTCIFQLLCTCAQWCTLFCLHFDWVVRTFGDQGSLLLPKHSNNLILFRICFFMIICDVTYEGPPNIVKAHFQQEKTWWIVCGYKKKLVLKIAKDD